MSFLNSLIMRLKTTWAARLVPRSFKARLRRAADRWSRPSIAHQIRTQVSQTNDLLARVMYEQAFFTPRFQEPGRLLRHGFKVYSQHDEDGILEEIFRRIGTTNRFFVEFGVGDGLENCTLYLLLKGWTGAWIDGSAACYEGILKNLSSFLEQRKLRAKHSFITAENIEGLFDALEVPREFDLLSIDIDRNDYWVWNAIRNYHPRVVAIEYNASLKATAACAVPYDPTATWDASNYYGASLKAFEYLGRAKGYSLVGCNYTGVTAFLVRNDCVGDLFAEPFTSENHYEPPRYFVRMPNGHPTAFGPVVRFEPDDLLIRSHPNAAGSSSKAAVPPEHTTREELPTECAYLSRKQ